MIYAKVDKATGKIIGHYTPDVHGSMFDSTGKPLSDDLIPLTEEEHQKSINGTLIYSNGSFTTYVRVPTKKEKFARINAEYSAKIARVCQVGTPSTVIDEIITSIRAEWKQKLLEVSNG